MIRTFLASLFLSLFALATTCAAATPDPSLWLSNPSAAQYDAGTGGLTITNVPTKLFSGGAWTLIGGAYPAARNATLTVHRAGDGTFTGDPSGPDLIVVGNGQQLLAAELTAFAYIDDPSNTDTADATLAVTGGTLSGQFGSTIHILLSIESVRGAGGNPLPTVPWGADWSSAGAIGSIIKP